MLIYRILDENVQCFVENVCFEKIIVKFVTREQLCCPDDYDKDPAKKAFRME